MFTEEDIKQLRQIVREELGTAMGYGKVECAHEWVVHDQITSRERYCRKCQRTEMRDTEGRGWTV